MLSRPRSPSSRCSGTATLRRLRDGRPPRHRSSSTRLPRQTLTYQMVGQDELPNAIALNSSLFNIADLGLLLDSDVPFVPQYAKRANAMKWIQIDIDPLKVDFPMWGFPTDMRIQGDCAIVLQQVFDAVEARADDSYRKRVADRIASWNSARDASAKRRSTASANKGVSGALNPAFVFATLSAKLRRTTSYSTRRSVTGRCCRSMSSAPNRKAMSDLPVAGLDFPAAWRWG